MEVNVEGDLMEKLVTLCKRRGFIFQSSEIYGGYNGFWDYGPYGVMLKRAVEQTWWKYMIEERDNVVGLDSTIICHPKVCLEVKMCFYYFKKCGSTHNFSLKRH